MLIQKFKDSSDFNKTLSYIIEQLKSLGHPLNCLDYDSDINRAKEVWGSNYHDQQADGIEIDFESPANIKVCWVKNL